MTLHGGHTLTVPVTFTPTTPGAQAGVLVVDADAGTVRVRPARQRGPSAGIARDAGRRSTSVTCRWPARVTRSVNITNTGTVD